MYLPLVNQILIESPNQNVPHPLSHDSWDQSSEEPYYPFVLIDLLTSIKNACIMLILICIVVLEQLSGSYDV